MPFFASGYQSALAENASETRKTPGDLEATSSKNRDEPVNGGA
jgi:hypothetical protein